MRFLKGTPNKTKTLELLVVDVKMMEVRGENDGFIGRTRRGRLGSAGTTRRYRPCHTTTEQPNLGPHATVQRHDDGNETCSTVSLPQVPHDVHCMHRMSLLSRSSWEARSTLLIVCCAVQWKGGFKGNRLDLKCSRMSD